MTEHDDLPADYAERSLFLVLAVLTATLILVVVVASW